MNYLKKACSLVLVAALALTIGFDGQTAEAGAAAKVSLSTKKLTIEKGKSKTLKIKNTKKKVSWKLSTKKYVTIKKTGKYKIKITGKKVGTTKITAKVGKKSYTCTVKVKKASKSTKSTAKPTITPSQTPANTATPTPDGKVNVKVHKAALNEAMKTEQILSNHKSFHVKSTAVEGLYSYESYITKETFYVKEGKEEYYVHNNKILSYEEPDKTGDSGYIIGLPFASKMRIQYELEQYTEISEFTKDEEILSSYCKDGKIYITSKIEGDSVAENYGKKVDGKEGVYALLEAVFDEKTLELLENKEYLCDKTGAKEWMRTSVITYDKEQPNDVTKMAENYDNHFFSKGLEESQTRKISSSLGVGSTQESNGTIKIPKGDGVWVYTDETFGKTYDRTPYKDKDCTEKFVSENDDRQSDLFLYFKLKEEEIEESDTIDYADGVSSKMSDPDFWANLSSKPDQLLATDERIKERNAEILGTKDTNMNDLVNMSESYNGIEVRNSLAKSVVSDAYRATYYANGQLVDKEEYFGNLKSNIAGNEDVTDNDTVKYAICTTRTEVKWCPTSDYIGYSATDRDDEGVNSAIGINEPMIIKAKTADGKFYWGFTTNCTGWVAAEDVAICSSKQEWLDAWEVEVGAKDFIVVTTDRIVTETSFYNPDISAKTLTLGTTLKLVAKADVPAQVDGRDTWNDYVVYMPTRNAEGNYEKKMALISEHCKVNVGYLPFTERNILNIAFECLGNRYGWGGSLEAMDCSLYACLVYRCFGFSLPRNTTWQMAMTSGESLSDMTDEEKTEEIKKAHVGSILYFPGHEMLYLGRYNGRTYVMSALGSLYDVGDTEKRYVYSVTINTLDVKRANGKTWLTNLSYLNSFDFLSA
ncbi:MAG: C40 family peptidase [Eubacterium sp.]|nr:C40 family peptidase [Eubacterium sp.]